MRPSPTKTSPGRRWISTASLYLIAILIATGGAHLARVLLEDRAQLADLAVQPGHRRALQALVQPDSIRRALYLGEHVLVYAHGVQVHRYTARTLGTPRGRRPGSRCGVRFSLLPWFAARYLKRERR